MPEASYGRATRWLTVILITPEAFESDREAVRQALEDDQQRVIDAVKEIPLKQF